MSSLTRRGIKLDLLFTQPTERRDVFSSDGTTYLWTDWHIDVIGELNPQLNSFKATAGTPSSTFGQSPASSDAAIRHLMMQPQGQLLWTVGSQTILSISDTDADNGPTPVSFDILKFLGEYKTWLVRFRIVAAVNECKGTGARPPILLSNRWVMSEDVDEDHFATRIIRGEAVFRNDVLRLASLNADQFRGILIHPIPAGFTREPVHCELDSDGNTYRYTIVDREDASSLLLGNADVAPGITRCEAYHTNYLQGAGVVQTFQNVAGGVIASVAAALSGSAALQALGRPGLSTSAIAGAGTAGGVGAAGRSLPTSYSHYLVKVWGNKSSLRINLQRTALAVAFSRFNALANAFAASSIEALMTHDLRGRYVELSLTIQRGALGAVQTRFPLGDATQAFGFPTDDHITGITLAPGTTRLGPPNSNQTRGTYLGALIAQALQQPCALPAAPVDPPNNADVVAQ